MPTKRTWIALFRAVNVGGTGKLPMAQLRATLESLGYGRVQTVLQSGNAVLDAAASDAAALERRIEGALAEHFALRNDVIVRSRDAWDTLVAGNPFDDAARDDPGHLLALVAKRPVSADGVRALEAAIARVGGRERAGAANGNVYVHFPDGMGRSKVTTAVIERALGTPVTGRNWNTVLKLATLAAGT